MASRAVAFKTASASVEVVRAIATKIIAVLSFDLKELE